MPKNKQLNKTRRGSGKKNAGPETANDFLSVGVDNEEAGEKWRAGDAAKSARFFTHAVENYDAGLKMFPQSMDLAFNKARLQYDIAQQPRLSAYLSTSLSDQLHLALDSHRFASKIDPNDEKLMFNTAQVLRSLAEVIEASKSSDNDFKALNLYKEALELFQRCLQAQELEFTRAGEEAARSSEVPVPSQDEETQMAGSAGPVISEGETWVTIVEPVTVNTLLDTIIEIIATLTAICGHFCAPNSTKVKHIEDTNGIKLKEIEEYFHYKIHDKLDAHLLTHAALCQEDDLKLAVANFSCALAEASFYSGRLSLSDYETEVRLAFSRERLGKEATLLKTPTALCDKANAEISFSVGIQSQLPSLLNVDPPHSLTELNNLRWRHLSIALEAVNTASKQQIHEPEALPRIHMVRGDCELLRYRMREKPCNYVLALNSGQLLLQNAEKCYRGAAGLAEKLGVVDEEKEAWIKSAVALALSGDGVLLGQLTAEDVQRVRGVVEEMGEESIISAADVESISRLFS